MSESRTLESEVQQLRLELASLTARVQALEAEKEVGYSSQNIHSSPITVNYHSPAVSCPLFLELVVLYWLLRLSLLLAVLVDQRVSALRGWPLPEKPGSF